MARISARDFRRIGDAVRYVESRAPLIGQGNYNEQVVGPSQMLGKTMASIPKGGIGDIKLYGNGTPNREEESDTLRGVINKFGEVDADKWVWVAQSERGFWYILQAECSDSAGGGGTGGTTS